MRYETGAGEWQRWARSSIEAARARGETEHHLFLLEHEPTVTFGVRAAVPGKMDVAEEERRRLREPPHGTRFVKADRGGLATYHGPGQLVGYAVLDLTQPPMKKDLHWLVRTVESVVVRTLREGFGVADAQPGPAGRSGVWVGSRKVCAVGIGVKSWITAHGFGLNVEPRSLDGFGCIVPCGVPRTEGDVTCVSDLVGRRVSVDEARPLVLRAFEQEFGVVGDVHVVGSPPLHAS